MKKNTFSLFEHHPRARINKNTVKINAPKEMKANKKMAKEPKDIEYFKHLKKK